MEPLDDLLLVGGHPALDLVNTVERGVPLPGRPQRDWLTEPRQLEGWAVRAGLVAHGGTATTEATSDVLAAMRRAREAAYLVVSGVLGDRAWDDPDVVTARETLHASWVAAAERAGLVPGARGGLEIVAGPTPWLVHDRAVLAVVDLLGSADVARVRACPVTEGGCGWVFLDQTKNHSRRWCRMEDCGTRVKARRLTERRRAARSRS